MRRSPWLVFVLFACSQHATAEPHSSGLKPVHLTTEFRTDPVGIATATPVFAWTLQPTVASARNLHQLAYRIRLVAAIGDPRRPTALLWDSGRIASFTYWQRPYTGPALHSHSTYTWQVQVWDAHNHPGPWSAPARFTTALLSPSDWTAHWIAAEPDGPSVPSTDDVSHLSPIQPPPLPVFRRDFKVRKPVASALLFVAGLGQYELHLNGRDVTDTVLHSGWTNYRKTVLYDTFDVSTLLRPGPNAFGILLGNGMYNVEGAEGHYTKFIGSFGQPKCLLQLEVRYTDGTSDRFLSDRSWQTHPGPIVFSSTYGGEHFDARALPLRWDRPSFPAVGWTPALEVDGPGGVLTAEQAPPMAVGQIDKPVRITTPKPGVTVYDLGQNMSGWPTLSVTGPAGSTVTLLPGELLNADGTVTQRSANAFPADPVLFSYTLRGGGPETWHPRFAYYSFRYVQVTTDTATTLLSLTGDFVHARIPLTGRFESSNTLFNRIHVLIDRAVLSNLASVITDCPSREKLGWLEETYLNAATLMLNYDVTGLYEKTAADIRDSQLPDGLVPSIAPEYVAFTDNQGRSNAFRDSPEWGSAVILSPWALFQHTGDSRILADNYANMQRYIAYLESKSSNNLLDYGLGDWYDIGPKDPGPSQLTSKLVTATGVFYEDLLTLAQIATLLGHTSDTALYADRAAAVGEAFNAKLFHPDTNQYDRGSQTANALPLALGLVPEGRIPAVLANLVGDIHAHSDHVTAGDIGFHYVVRALTDRGRSDVLAAMFSRTDFPSYGYQLDRGATTLTEAWDANPNSSQNHFMLGHGDEWFYRGLAGLSIDMARGPDDAIHLTPSLLPGIDHASASFHSPMGDISIAWRQTSTSASIDVSIPAGATAHLKLPSTRRWRESSLGSPSLAAKDLTLGSGRYRFLSAGRSTPRP